jgi:hypothetical protein
MPRVQREKLAAAVAKAVKAASAKHGAPKLEPHLFQQDIARLPWWIVGRVLHEHAIEFDRAHDISSQIAANVSKTIGVPLQPSTLIIDKDILVGFIEHIGGDLEIGDLMGGGGPAGLR